MSQYNVSAVGESNLAATLLRAVQLGVATGEYSLGSATKNFTAIKTPYPCRVEIKTQLASGSGTLTADVNATGTYAAADKTLALSGTAEQIMTVDTTAGNLYVNLRLVGSSLVFDADNGIEAKVFALLADNDNGTEVKKSFNACRAQNGVWTSGESDG
jgi:hypothetical protein